LTFFNHKGIKGLSEHRHGSSTPGVFLGGGGDCDMKPSPKLLTWPALGGSLLVLAALYSWSGGAARAQNIDAGKSAPRLFADSCVNCHRNPKGLARGRFRPTLFLFLQDHYTASTGAAWELASYLAAVDTPPRGRPKTSASHPTTATHRSPIRPPAPVPPQ
jgi:mono/diheme cytochrome c family protein